jgi:ArsR family transcriptional regulator, arsenate/arsenite/antimonite-responsive transcriptional repressor
MCDCKGCQQPEKLKGKPGDCSPEQIRECHGDVENHPCEEPESNE